MYTDAKHRPHAIHTGEIPSTKIARGPESLVVTLDNWPMREPNLFASLYDALVSNWGEDPSRTVTRDCLFKGSYVEMAIHLKSWEHNYGWCKLTTDEQSYVEQCFAGKTLQQALERFTFSFCVDGCTRAETHQIVRTRVGAGFMQHGGRDNDWRHRRWTMPETIARACDADLAQRQASEQMPDGNYPYPVTVNDRAVCVKDWGPIEAYLQGHDFGNTNLYGAVRNYLDHGKALYAALVDAGIPWQDARRVLWMGTQTYIHCDYNYVALKGVLGNRLEHIMDWEVNCVAQLMQREVNMKCPPIFGRYLGSHSDRAGKATFAGLESWPPDGKWPNPFERCATCGHARADHKDDPEDMSSDRSAGVQECTACNREGRNPMYDATLRPAGPLHNYKGVDTLPRQHSAEQMPFFVLSPAAMAGGPVEWLWTNGTFPQEAR